MATIWLTGECECEFLQNHSDEKRYLCHKNENKPIEVGYYDCKACGQIDFENVFFDGSDD